MIEPLASPLPSEFSSRFVCEDGDDNKFHMLIPKFTQSPPREPTILVNLVQVTNANFF